MKLYELAYACHTYHIITNGDKSYREFLDKTKPVFDITNHQHREELFVWLRKWGCRQFAKKSEDSASEYLKDWGQKNIASLPPEGTSLLRLTEGDLKTIGTLYESLYKLPASVRQCSGKNISVAFGPTGAAKILFILSGEMFPPWDVAIRNNKCKNNSSEPYINYLRGVIRELQEVIADAEKYGIKAKDIPQTLNRPRSSIPKLVDEYNWVTITKNGTPPTFHEIDLWRSWAKPLELLGLEPP